MINLVGAIAAIMSSVSSGAAKTPDAPVYLVAERVEQGVRLKVLGASAAVFEGTFSIEVIGNGNQSRHRGSASLKGGEGVTLSVVTLGHVQPGEWHARLQVEPHGGQPYEQVRTSF